MEAMCRAVRFVKVETRVTEKLQNTFVCRELSLEKYVKHTSPSPEELVNVNLGRKTVLASELENKLVEYCIIVDQSYYGMRRQDIKSLAFQLAIRNVLKRPFNQENSEAWKK
jgi:hypothetical protein